MRKAGNPSPACAAIERSVSANEGRRNVQTQISMLRHAGNKRYPWFVVLR
jgi:hypothetical protein